MPFTPAPINKEKATSPSNTGGFTQAPAGGSPESQKLLEQRSHPPAEMSASSHILSSIANFIPDVSHNAAKAGFRSLAEGAELPYAALDETLGRVGNIVSGKGNVPTNTAQGLKDFAEQPGLKQDDTAAGKIGGAVEFGAELALPGEEVIDGVRKLPAEALKSPIAQKVASILGNEGAKIAEEGKKTAEDAWKILQPKKSTAADKVYRPSGNMTPRSTFKGSQYTPRKADQAMIDATTPLIDSGKLKPNMAPEVQHQVIGDEVKEMNAGVKKYVAENNAEIQPETIDSNLATAKKENDILFGNDATIEGHYDAVIDKFKSFVKTNDSKGLLQARQDFDKYMRQKFPNYFKKNVAGELTATDNARIAAMRDVRETANTVVSDSLPEGNPYKSTLKNESALLNAMNRIDSNAVGTTGKNAISLWLKKHPAIRETAKIAGTAIGASSLTGLGFELLSPKE